MATITGNASITYGLQEKISTGYLSPINLPLAISSAANYNNSGTGAGQLDTGFGKPIVLVASTPQTFDLTSITDQAGATLNFARVREFVGQVLDATAGHDVKIYQGATNGWAMLPPPALPPSYATATSSTTGGTFAAATYYYKISATNAYGETVGSTEISATTTGSTGSIALAWASVPGATGYKIYRATSSGGESGATSLVTTIGSGTTTTYTDTGTATTTGSVLTTSTAASSFPLWARANGGLLTLRDINSSGAGNGNIVTSTSKTFTLDSGANNVTLNLLALGTSVA